MRTAGMKSRYAFGVSIEVDKETGDCLAAYLSVRKGRFGVTKHYARGKVLADYDPAGTLLGVEMLAPFQVSVFDQLTESDQNVKRFLKRSIPRQFIQPRRPQRPNAK